MIFEKLIALPNHRNSAIPFLWVIEGIGLAIVLGIDMKLNNTEIFVTLITFLSIFV